MVRYLSVALLLALAPALYAARPEGSVLKKDGNSVPFRSIEGETLSGIEWRDANRNPGTRIEIWDVDQVRYSFKGMDQFNGLSKKLQGGRGDVLEKDAATYVSDPGKDLDDDDKRRVKLTAMYYVARGKLLQSNAEAATAFLNYLKEAEAVAKEGPGKAGNPQTFTVRGVTFDSPTGNKVAEAGLLHRLYLDALEGLGESFVRADNPDEGAKKGYDKLVELTTALAKRSGKNDYYDWALRALRAAASVAESSKGDRKDVAKKTREVFEKLAGVALLRAGGKESRDVVEANLRVGMLMVEEGNAGGAQGRFSGAIREWEQELGDIRNPIRTPPKPNWINADRAYKVAGCYLGMGLVLSSSARTVDEWAAALRQFSIAIGMFPTDPEMRGMSLLGAAKACAEMAKGTKDKEAAARHASTGEIYLLELRATLGNTKAASSPDLPDITKTIDSLKDGK